MAKPGSSHQLSDARTTPEQPPAQRCEDDTCCGERGHEGDAAAPMDHVHSGLIVVDVDQAEDESKAEQHDRRQDHRPR